ncbi:PilZ domain-containing protein [Sphingomonas sp. SRS2]|uniref:PilZ domain-containing protein n=1 Tax=Sphingomonas sp. SRS2 TaxID=133190 RepID=UPI0006184986|nr:PilZ domain-containing protein [Sphingomonas sp. SRS2]KKC27837.1 pilus assembly protein PilZ [Sphingomonas sp. SRS2]
MSIASALGFRSRPDARQGGSRTRVLLQASLLANGRPMRVHLLDLSGSGALGHGDDPPQPGEIVWLVCKGSEILARTAWVRGNRFGLAFDTALPSAKLGPLLSEGRRALEAGGQTPAFA